MDQRSRTKFDDQRSGTKFNERSSRVQALDHQGVTFPCRIFVASKSNTGKTNYIKHFIKKQQNKIDYLFVVSYSGDDDWEMSSKCWDKYDSDVIKFIYEFQEKRRIQVPNPKYPKESRRQYIYEYPSSVVVLDDLLGNVNMTYTQEINKLYTQGRHKNITPIILTQKYKGVGSIIRTNASYVFLLSHSNKTQIDSIYEEYGGKFSKDQFRDFLQKNTTNYGVLIIDNKYSDIKYYHDKASSPNVCLPEFDLVSELSINNNNNNINDNDELKYYLTKKNSSMSEIITFGNFIQIASLFQK